MTYNNCFIPFSKQTSKIFSLINPILFLLGVCESLYYFIVAFTGLFIHLLKLICLSLIILDSYSICLIF